MKTKQRGFIALFFVLSMSSILLTWITLSSSGVFLYLHGKQDFDEYYLSTLQDGTCADTFLDYLIRGQSIADFSRNLFYGDIVVCHISNIQKTEISADEWLVTFVSGQLKPRIRVKNGFIKSL